MRNTDNLGEPVKMSAGGSSSDDRLVGILRSADKHPNSKVAKLIREFEAHRSPQNIVLLMIELAANSEYAADFNISLSYYLDNFSSMYLGNQVGFNDGGVFLLNSARVYSRRVDYNRDHVAGPSSGTADTAGKPEDGTSGEDNAESPKASTKGGRKRTAAAVSDPFTIELEPKKYRCISGEKRFQPADKVKKAKLLFANIMDSDYFHPAQWKHSRMRDFDNVEEVDSKRNYKVFTSHLEHRYNTLVEDINFRLHFLMKDFLQEAEQSGEIGELAMDDWSEQHSQYISKYLSIENRVFRRELERQTGVEIPVSLEASLADKTSCNNSTLPSLHESGYASMEQTASNAEEDNTAGEDNTAEEDNTAGEDITLNESSEAADCSQNDTTPEDMSLLLNKDTSCANEGFTNLNSTAHPGTDSGIGESLAPNESSVQDASQLADATEDSLDLSRILVDLRPHFNDKIVPFTQLSRERRAMLSPKVVLTDVFPRIPNKESLKLIVDDEILALNNVPEPETFVLEEPVTMVRKAPLVLNILKINEKLLRHNRLFKLGAEYDLYLEQRRNNKRTKTAGESSKRQFKPPEKPASKEVEQYFLDPMLWIEPHRRLPWSPQDDGDLLGFPEYVESVAEAAEVAPTVPALEEPPSEEDAQARLDRLSKDSGISDVDKPGTEPEEDSGNFTADSTLESIPEAREGDVTALEHDDAFPELSEPMDSGISDPLPEDDEGSPARTPPEGRAEMLRQFFMNDSNQDEDAVPAGFVRSDSEDAENPEFQALQERIRTWHEKLQPILAKSHGRHHFDVYQLGSDVIERFEPATPERMVSFQDVMEQRDKTHASRYLLATLLLTNQGNVRIHKEARPPDQPSAWDDIKLQLLSTTRQKVAIEDNIGMISTKTKATESSKAPAKSASGRPAGKKKPAPICRPSIDDDDDDEAGNIMSPPATPMKAPFCPPQKRRRYGSHASLPSPLPTSTPFGFNASSQVPVKVSFDLSAVRPLRRIEQKSCTDDDIDSGVGSNME